MKIRLLYFSGLFLIFILFVSAKNDNLIPAWEQSYFSHKLHFENDVTCDVCHTDMKNPVPAFEECSACHDEEINSEFINLVKDLKSYRKGYGYFPHPEFSHPEHLEASAKCEDCHGNMTEVDMGTQENWPKHDQCWKCHNDKNAPADCNICHLNLKERKPADHTSIFINSHGKLASTSKGKDCLNCHKFASNCSECHRGDNFESYSHPHDYIFNHKLKKKTKKFKCSTCHSNSSFCSECHIALSIWPESHNEPDFKFISHKNYFKSNPNDCITCHSQSSPVCFKCHSIKNK